VNMKRSILRALALCLTTGFVVGYAQAQDDKSNSGLGNQSSQSALQGRTSTVSEQDRAGILPSLTPAQTAQPVRLGRLLNTSVPGQTGGSLGQLQDIIVDPVSGQVQFVVLSLNDSVTGTPGTIGATTKSRGIGGTEISSPKSPPSNVGSYGTPVIGNKLVAIPWRLVSRTSGDQLMVNVDAAKLQSAPSFNATTWPTMDSEWTQRMNSHFGVDGTSVGAPGTGTGAGTGTGINNAPATSPGVGNPSTPGLPATPGTPDIGAPTPSPNATPGAPSATGTPSGTGTGLGTGTSGTGVGTGGAGTGTGTGTGTGSGTGGGGK
jgi:hypothetical protein